MKEYQQHTFSTFREHGPNTGPSHESSGHCNAVGLGATGKTLSEQMDFLPNKAFSSRPLTIVIPSVRNYDPVPQELQEPNLTHSGCPQRSEHSRQLPMCYHDEMPPGTVHDLPGEGEDSANDGDTETGLHDADMDNTSAAMDISNDLHSNTSQDSIYDTDIDSFDTFCSYFHQPPSFMSTSVSLESFCDSPNFAVQRKVRNWWSGIARCL
ncbi:hypothetical protein APHAL10511_007525 [Amanita phalloides]|nr:hypothetical protein APHAL10511_007525 [Amanita phalloides]